MSQTIRKRRIFRFRNILIGFILLLFILGNMGCFTFRKSDKAQTKFMLEHGQVAPSFHNFELQGQKIHYTHLGADSLPLVILVHGSPGSSSACLDYLADTSLSKVAQLVTLDRPGFGYSAYGKGDPSLANQAKYIKYIIEQHKAPKVILVGHSLGGPIILRVGLDYPELVDGLIVVAGSMNPDLEPREAWFRVPLSWKAINWMVPGSFRASNDEILPHRQELRDMIPLYPKLVTPTTVFQGTADMLVDAKNADYAEAKLVNCKALVVKRLEKANHFIFWSKRDLITAEIKRIIAG